MQVERGTVVVYADIACPWAHVAVARLHAARRRLGLDDAVAFDHRSFPLELANEQPTPFATLHAEIPVTAALEPGAGWQPWKAPVAQWPVSTLLALEAVQVAKEQSLQASAELDRTLRVAFFAHSECITMRHVVLDVAKQCPSVDVAALAAALDSGRGRSAVSEQWEAAQRDGVQGSPHLFFADGSDAHNPGITMHLLDAPAKGIPVVDDDDPSVYDALLERAAG